MAENQDKKKQHADFQDRYRRSSNFRSTNKKVRLVLAPDGSLKLENIDQEDKKVD
jgi:hypothetical protein